MVALMQLTKQLIIPPIYYRISTSCQSLHLSVVYVISAIFLNHQNRGVQIARKEFAQNALDIMA
jgi:hypothetical protein